MLVVPGTGLLTDFSSNPLGLPYRVLKWSAIARLRGCKLLFVSVGAGPMYHPMTKWLIRASLSLAEYRSYRDTYSKQFLDGVGFKTDADWLYPDLAFSLPKGLFPERTSRSGQRTVVGVGVKDYCGVLGLPERGGEAKYREFINNLATFVTWLVRNKYTVRLLIGDESYDNTVKQDLMKLLQPRLSEYEVGQIINDPASSVEDVVSQIAATDIVVSARFHNILLAIMLNKPAISLSYHPKFTSLMAGVGLAAYSHDIDELDVNRLTEQISDLEKKAPIIKPYIAQKVADYRTALDEQYTRIFARI
jgi:polysaccharide pyruvyl transferase WcaK-like protein